MVLSMGEKQRLSFVRLLALFTLSPNKDQLVQETLVFLDESTSAIDIRTEREIYLHLTQLCVWFVTISHRSSLVHLHTKWLQFFPDKNCQQTIEPERTEDQLLFTSTDKDLDEDKLEKQEKDDYKPIETKQLQVSFVPSSVLFVHS
jgi:ABC-type bacteriocin/lantibiotic exporter with double-glycine peptidase domain